MVGRSWRVGSRDFSSAREEEVYETKRRRRRGRREDWWKSRGKEGKGRPSSLRREIRAARPLIWIGGRHSRGKERKGETETCEKVTRQSRGIRACETWKRKGGEEGWRRDNRCIKIPNLNERSFRSSSNGGLSTVACFLSNDLTTIFETIAAITSRVLVSNPTSKPGPFYLFISFTF